MDKEYYKSLWRETNAKRERMGMKSFTWKEYQTRINRMLERNRRELAEYDETGDKEAEETE